MHTLGPPTATSKQGCFDNNFIKESNEIEVKIEKLFAELFEVIELFERVVSDERREKEVGRVAHYGSG